MWPIARLQPPRLRFRPGCLAEQRAPAKLARQPASTPALLVCSGSLNLGTAAAVVAAAVAAAIAVAAAANSAPAGPPGRSWSDPTLLAFPSSLELNKNKLDN